MNRQQIALLEAERDELKTKLDAANKEFNHEKHCADSYHKKWTREEGKRIALEKQLDAAQKACAEMRDVLRDAQMWIEAENIDWSRFNDGPDHDPNYKPEFPEIVEQCKRALHHAQSLL